MVDSIEIDVNPQYLEGLGFSILRFENRLVFQEPEFVKNKIRKTFKRKDPEFE